VPVLLAHALSAAGSLGVHLGARGQGSTCAASDEAKAPRARQLSLSLPLLLFAFAFCLLFPLTVFAPGVYAGTRDEGMTDERTRQRQYVHYSTGPRDCWIALCALWAVAP
jgi:hypothetical protein